MGKGGDNISNKCKDGEKDKIKMAEAEEEEDEEDISLMNIYREVQISFDLNLKLFPFRCC